MVVVVKDLFLIFPLAPMDAHQLEEEEEEEEVMLDQANLEAVPQIAIKGGEEDFRVEEHDVSAGPSGLADPSRPDEEQAGSVEDVLLLSLYRIIKDACLNNPNRSSSFFPPPGPSGLVQNSRSTSVSVPQYPQVASDSDSEEDECFVSKLIPPSRLQPPSVTKGTCTAQRKP